MNSTEADFKEGVLIQEALRLLSQRWVSSGDIEALPAKMGVKGEALLSVKIFILNQLLEIYRKVPDCYFKEEDHRANLLEAVQEALDDLIEEEEESYENGGDDEDEDDDDIDLDFNF